MLFELPNDTGPLVRAADQDDLSSVQQASLLLHYQTTQSCLLDFKPHKTTERSLFSLHIHLTAIVMGPSDLVEVDSLEAIVIIDNELDIMSWVKQDTLKVGGKWEDVVQEGTEYG
jgi:hypothetical protein